MRFLRNICRAYTTVLYKRPKSVQAIQSAMLMGGGDCLAQVIAQPHGKLEELNWSRFLRYGSIGLVLGPGIYVWYSVLERFVGKKGLRVALTKIVLDQALFAPILLFILVATVAYYVREEPFSDIKKMLHNNYFNLVIANYKLWPMVQLVNFTLIPHHYRVLFVQSVSLFWNTYISWTLNVAHIKNNVVSQ